jgi:aminomuconate-semialdehyde/2-hydroxymuconate-6-semialdehyde dehydrogenase
MKELRNYVAGEWLSSTRTFEKRSPYDGSHVAVVHEAEQPMVDAAVEAGRAAWRGAWGTLPVGARVGMLRDLSVRLKARLDDLIEAEVADTGRPYWQARNFDGLRAIGVIDAYCDLAMGLENRSSTFPVDGVMGGFWYSVRRPKGVIACIAPWNVPLLMMLLKVVPALLMGNSVIAKPSEETPSSCTLLAEIISQTDIPPGAFSMLHGFGAGSTGEWLTTHTGVDAVMFTGESGTGSAIMQAAAKGLRDVAFELGGKNAAIIFDDADMDRTIEGMVRAAFFNCGQICFCTERAYVHRSRYDEFLARLSEAARRIVIGQRDHAGFSIGPLISQGHREKVLGLLETIVKDGGTIVEGGGIPDFNDARSRGSFVQPTIAIGLPETARFVKNEVFGPVIHVRPFDEEQEVIALANDSLYGLATSIWTNSISRAHRVAPQIRVGHAWINSWQLRDLQSPLTGAGMSGIGEQFGRSSLDFCTQPQTITVRVFDK